MIHTYEIVPRWAHANTLIPEVSIKFKQLQRFVKFLHQKLKSGSCDMIGGPYFTDPTKLTRTGPDQLLY